MKKNRRQMELSAILLCAALLIVSLIQLSLNLTAGTRPVSAVSSTDPYPDLYAPNLKPIPMDTSQNFVYLTFDDGPSPNTERLVEILKKHGAKATFFVTAQQWEEDYLSEMYGKIVEEGHTLGLHSYTHKFEEIYASPDAFLRDIDRLQKFVEESCGYRPSILRFPGGCHSKYASKYTINTLIGEIGRRGYLWYDWDVSTEDHTPTPRRAEDIAQTIIKGVESRDMATIVLCHDNSTPKTTPDAIEIVLSYFTGKGYEFRALPSYHCAVPRE